MRIELEFIDKNKKLEKKIFITGKVKARMVRKATTISEETNFDKLTTEALDNMVKFMCEVYGDQFTIDELYDGIEAYDLIPILIKTVQGITSGVTERLEKFPQK